VNAEVAKRVIVGPGIVPGGDALFPDTIPQAWKAKE
jgi:hypothetical protein